MRQSVGARFSVAPENEEAALAYLAERDFQPVDIESDSEGLIVLTFPPLPVEQMTRLAQALPIHLSAKIGIVVGDRWPCGLADGEI